MDPDHLDDSLKDGRLEVSTSWETNADDGTAGSDVFSSLLEWLLVDGDKDDNVGTKAIGRCLLYIGDKVLGCREVDECFGAKVVDTHVPLLLASVNGNGSYTHGLCILAGERSETTSGTNNSSELAGLDAGFLQALVDRDTGAEDRCNGGQVTFLGDAGNVGSLGDAVLLEGAVDSVSRQKGSWAERLIGCLAVVTRQARAV